MSLNQDINEEVKKPLPLYKDDEDFRNFLATIKAEGFDLFEYLSSLNPRSSYKEIKNESETLIDWLESKLETPIATYHYPEPRIIRETLIYELGFQLTNPIRNYDFKAIPIWISDISKAIINSKISMFNSQSYDLNDNKLEVAAKSSYNIQAYPELTDRIAIIFDFINYNIRLLINGNPYDSNSNTVAYISANTYDYFNIHKREIAVSTEITFTLSDIFINSNITLTTNTIYDQVIYIDAAEAVREQDLPVTIWEKEMGSTIICLGHCSELPLN